ncbi:hypothetical protein C0989_001364 [Termitomyces sp. Mn162]|nr:hypothetical protein C0989_001364 [Termitomyces sp. Mn162]
MRSTNGMSLAAKEKWGKLATNIIHEQAHTNENIHKKRMIIVSWLQKIKYPRIEGEKFRPILKVEEERAEKVKGR